MAAREKFLLKYFENHPNRVRLVDGHGVLKGGRKIVPKDTVIMFLSKVGYCMAINAGRSIHKKYFESNTGLIKFFKSGNTNRRNHHVTDIMSRTYLPGTVYQDLSVKIVPEPGEPTMGFLKKLPLKRKNLPPLLGNTVGPTKKDKYLLSKIIRAGGPGIYIVSACRVSPYNMYNNNNDIPINLPMGKFGYRNPYGRYAKISRSIKRLHSKPGAKRRTRFVEFTPQNERSRRLTAEGRSMAPRPTKKIISNVLNRMVVTPNNKSRNIRRYAWNLPANKNVESLNETLRILRAPRTFVKTLSIPVQRWWDTATPRQKAEFIFATKNKNASQRTPNNENKNN